MESIETLNERLKEHFGTDADDPSKPIFRIVWSEDQTEKRRVECSEAGVRYLFPQVETVKKYSYIRNLYILERLVLVPEVNKVDLPDIVKSYEPVWTYQDAYGNPRPPVWPMTKFVIDALYAALGKNEGLAKYVDDEKNTTPEGREQRISELQAELFGDETDAGDALRYGEGVVVPSNYQSDKVN